MTKRITYRGIYEQTSADDGDHGDERVLVDRVWPDGIRRRGAPLDKWLRELAPSPELQRWYRYDPLRFGEFRRRYLAELGDPDHRRAAAKLHDLAQDHSLTLLTATRDTEHSHAAVLAEWLADPDHAGAHTDGPGRSLESPPEPAPGRGTDKHPDPDPGKAGPVDAAAAAPAQPGFREFLATAATGLNAGALAFVMGTGIVSTALYLDGARAASAALLWAALAGFAVLLPVQAWRLARRRQRFVTELLGPRSFVFLTIAISANVLAARLVPDGHTTAAAAFLAFGAVGWLLLDYGIPIALITTLRRSPSFDQVNGTWFLWAVGSQSVAVGAVSLAHTGTGHVLPILAAVCFAVGLVQYLLTAGIVLARLLARPVRPEGLMTSVWIFMGAAAITVLVGVRLTALPTAATLLPRSVLMGSSVVLWAFSTWLIPLLLALGVWRHAVRRIPLRYDTGWWNLVFPIGMYAVTTHELGRATGTSWMVTMGRWEIWVSAVVWAVTFAAMVVSLLRLRSRAARGLGPRAERAPRPGDAA
ncbi:SLAC1 family transporter [Streptomyces adustus]|uniref:SLAC1 family transporter n=1 Tax=Streptomyces adustus TaxID=1609272 RepID=UPI00371466A8